MRAFRLLVILILTTTSIHAADVDEFKVKREGDFTFLQKPEVTRDKDRISVAFETKAFCDVTVAVEDGQGTILRHLASGAHRAELKAAGFRYASKKQRWYFRPEGWRSVSRGAFSMDDIRDKYGSSSPNFTPAERLAS